MPQSLAESTARRCSSRWAGIALEARAFATHLQDLLGKGSPPPPDAWLDELYLACAAGHGDPRAIEVLDAEYLTRLGPALVRLQGPSTLADDVRQQLRETLLLGSGERRPRIFDFAGRSALLPWLRAAAARKGLTLVSRDGPHFDDERFVQNALSQGDPELDRLKSHDAAKVREALHAAFRSLPLDVRRELKQYYLEGLDLKAMGRLYSVNVSTVSRRLAKSREALHQALRREVSGRLQLGPRDADSLIRGLQSRLESSRVSWWGS